MSKYTFSEECDNLDRCAREMREALRAGDTHKANHICCELHNAAARLMRKIEKYDDWCELVDTIAPFAKVKNPLELEYKP